MLSNFMKAEIGKTFYQKHDPRKYHIVAIINEPKVQIVYKYFGIHRKYWHYEIIWEYTFNLNFESGYWTEKRINNAI